jgi:ubiquinone/menaquinone biosynthesis C-methylase UbiE
MSDRWLADEIYDAEVNPRGIDLNIRAGPQLREYIAIADRIAADRPGRVLDWGCGWGQMTDLLARRGIDVEAFDVNPAVSEPTRRALENFPPHTALISGDERTLPYPDGGFDAVLSCGVLEHVVDPDRSLDELRRVLRPGGRLFVYKLPNRYSYLEKIAKVTGLYYHGRLEHDRLYTPFSARDIVERHGFVVTELRRANMLPLGLPGRLASRAAHRIWRANQALARVPLANVLATNVELVAQRPDEPGAKSARGSDGIRPAALDR